MKNNYNDISLASTSDVLDDNNEFLFRVLNEVNRWSDCELELAQGRSNFQIEKFIIHDNFTIPTAFKAALINRKGVAEDILQRVIDAKSEAREFNFKWEGKDKTQPIWWKTPEGGEKLCWYDIDEFHFNRTLENINVKFKALVQELDFFDKIIDRLIQLNGGKAVTKEQFDNDQPIYWERRLSNQSLDNILQAKTGINSGNISSMRRASASTVLADDKNRTRGSFDFTDHIKLLEDLQKNVESGISEISGRDKKIISNIEKEQKKLGSTFFNHNLKK